MLVVVHHRNIKFFFQPALYFKTFGSLDVFQVDTAESGSNSLDCFDKLVGVFLVHFDIEYIDAGIDFEQQPFSFHNGLSAERTYVAQTENGGSVGDYSYQIAFGCIFICVLRVLLDFEARFCNTRRISE